MNPSYNWEGCVSHHGNYDTISPDERNIWSLAHEDPYEHLRNLEVVCGPFVFKSISQEFIRLTLFPFSLTGDATR